jgi:hypothetical protein
MAYPPIALWPQLWIVEFRRGLVSEIELPVTICLLGKAHKGGGQIFKLGAQRWINFSIGSSKQLKSLRPIIVPRDHAEALCLFTRYSRV